MTIEDYQVQVVEELMSGEILGIKKGNQVDYIIYYENKRESFCKAEWLDKVLPLLKPGKIEIGMHIFNALILNPGGKTNG